jgi:SAM-dependent methyltransferase
MPTPDVIAFVRALLPAPPARVLEVGAGEGELAAVLSDAGYDVLAIDPSPGGANVQPVALADVREADGSFDAAVAVLSLHHVEPLEASLDRLAALVRRGGTLVVDEFDVALIDDAALAWWSAQRAAQGHDHPADPVAMLAEMRAHLHPLDRLRDVLGRGFRLSETERGPYLHRWHLEPGLRDAEEQLIAAGRLPVVGARFVGTRR